MSREEEMATRREKQTDAGGTGASGTGTGGTGTGGTGTGGTGSAQSTAAAEERRTNQGTQGEAKTGGNGSPATGAQSTQGAAVERQGEGAGGRGVATRGAGVNRLATQGLAGWPTLFTSGVAMSPFELVRRMSEDIDQLFESLRLGGTGVAPAATGATGLRTARGARDTGLLGRALFAPPIEVQQRADAVVVRLDLPGVDADEIEIDIEDDMLIISGERRQENREEREGLIRSEITYGRFQRVIPLPRGADEERMTAQLRGGTLEVVIPIAKRERGRRVQVQS
jgi:HSP20 family protein